jgi:hypothetical protein
MVMCPHSLHAGASPIMSPRTSCTVATEFSACSTGAVSVLATGAVSVLATGAVSVLATGAVSVLATGAVSVSYRCVFWWHLNDICSI